MILVIRPHPHGHYSGNHIMWEALNSRSTQTHRLESVQTSQNRLQRTRKNAHINPTGLSKRVKQENR